MEKLGKYEIRGVLGRGAMGTVYEAWDPIISRRVAIKTVRLPDSEDSEEREQLGRFQQEAQAAGRLHHPNIVGVFDYGETNDVAFIVMEFVDGQTLRSITDPGARPSMAEVQRLMDGLLTGLAFSHSHGVIHRDIKPANIIVTKSGGVKIADFGIARIDSSTMTQSGSIMGTPAYMSPEQFGGLAVDSRTDIYSAGVVLFHLVTGRRPYEGTMATIMQSVLNGVAPAPSSIDATLPPWVDAIVARAMARSPKDRFPDADTFNRVLQTAGDAAAKDADGIHGSVAQILGEDATVVQKSGQALGKRSQIADRKSAAPRRASRAAQPDPAKRGARIIAALATLAVLAVAAGSAAVWALSGSSVAPARQAEGDRPAPTDLRQRQERFASSVPALSATTPPASPVRQGLPPLEATPAISAPVIPAAPPPGPLAVAPVIPPSPPDLSSRPATQPPPSPALLASPAPFAPAPASRVPVAPAPAANPDENARSPLPLPRPASAAAPPSPPASPPPASQPQTFASVQPTPAEPSVTAPPRLDGGNSVTLPPPQPHRSLADALASAPCSLVTADDSARLLTLRGVAGPPTNTAALRTIAQETAPGEALDLQLDEITPAFCDLLDVLRSKTQPPQGPLRALVVGLADGRTDLQAGDLVQPKVRLPEVRSYLQLDYVASDGSILHMHDSRPGAPYPPDSGGSFGSPRPNFPGWAVDEPFGTDVILAVATATPLFQARQTLAETSDAYAAQLREALAGGKLLAVAVLPVHTRTKQ